MQNIYLSISKVVLTLMLQLRNVMWRKTQPWRMKNAAMTQQKTSPQEHQSIPIFDFHPTPACNMHKVMDHAELLSDTCMQHAQSHGSCLITIRHLHATCTKSGIMLNYYPTNKFHILHYPLYILRMFKNASFNQLHCEYHQ